MPTGPDTSWPAYATKLLAHFPAILAALKRFCARVSTWSTVSPPEHALKTERCRALICRFPAPSPRLQANFYGFARLAWDPWQSSATIHRDWAAQTFSPGNTSVLDAVVEILETSWLIYEKYNSPLGLGFLCEGGYGGGYVRGLEPDLRLFGPSLHRFGLL